MFQCKCWACGKKFKIQSLADTVICPDCRCIDPAFVKLESLEYIEPKHRDRD